MSPLVVFPIQCEERSGEFSFGCEAWEFGGRLCDDGTGSAWLAVEEGLCWERTVSSHAEVFRLLASVIDGDFAGVSVCEECGEIGSDNCVCGVALRSI